MHSNSDNREFMVHDNINNVIEKLFESTLNRYRIGLELSMKGSDFIFDCVHLLYYKCHKINPNQGGSYINSSDWTKSNNATINPVNKKLINAFNTL